MNESIRVENENRNFVSGILSHLGSFNELEKTLNNANYSAEELNNIKEIDKYVRDLYNDIVNGKYYETDLLTDYDKYSKEQTIDESYDLNAHLAQRRLRRIKNTIQDMDQNPPSSLMELIGKIEHLISYECDYCFESDYQQRIAG